MKIRTTIALIAIGLVLSLPQVLRSSETKADSTISYARSVIMTPDFSRDAIVGALIEVLEASLLIMPKTDYAEEFKSRVEVAKKIFEEKNLFSDKTRQYLGLAYKLVTGGKGWQLPEELTSAYREKDIMEQAKKICQKLLDSAQAELKAGRDGEAVRYLLEFVLMVITPVEA